MADVGRGLAHRGEPLGMHQALLGLHQFLGLEFHLAGQGLVPGQGGADQERRWPAPPPQRRAPPGTTPGAALPLTWPDTSATGATTHTPQRLWAGSSTSVTPRDQAFAEADGGVGRQLGHLPQLLAVPAGVVLRHALLARQRAWRGVPAAPGRRCWDCGRCGFPWPYGPQSPSHSGPA